MKQNLLSKVVLRILCQHIVSITVIVFIHYICSELSIREQGEQIELVIIFGVTLVLAELYYVLYVQNVQI